MNIIRYVVIATITCKWKNYFWIYELLRAIWKMDVPYSIKYYPSWTILPTIPFADASNTARNLLAKYTKINQFNLNQNSKCAQDTYTYHTYRSMQFLVNFHHKDIVNNQSDSLELRSREHGMEKIVIGNGIVQSLFSNEFRTSCFNLLAGKKVNAKSVEYKLHRMIVMMT